MIGRRVETDVLNQLLESDKAELLAILGRRRVGKTYLIKQVYADHIMFDFIGTQYATKRNQLKKFANKLTEYQGSNINFKTPEDWAEAFEQLKIYLVGLRKSKKKYVIFFDELPWIASHRSGFLNEFSYWWNDWTVNQKNLVVVVCGSAASWMIKKVINHKGGLHNRITQLIHLKPFTLAECRQFFNSNHINLDYYQTVQIYMAIGGVPYYLEQIRPGETATQNIERICFAKDGILKNEFDNLYTALYDFPENYIDVIRSLSTRWKGLTRQEIIELTKLSDGGGLSKVLAELETSSFITSIVPFDKKKKEMLYRLTDEYSLFYLKFIQDQKAGQHNLWAKQSTSAQYRIWCGYAFENLCIKHVEAIKYALGISGISANVSSYRGDDFQIDMLIDRADHSINICEMKYYNDDLIIDKKMAETLRRRREKFRRSSGTKKQLFNTIVTTFGVQTNEHKLSQVDQVVTVEELFELDRF